MANRTLPTLFVAIYFILSLFVLAHFLNSSWLGDRRGAAHHFEAMYDGTAARPFVYRALVPAVARTVTNITPEPWQEEADRALKSWAQEISASKKLPWMTSVFPMKEPAYPRLVTIVLIYASLVGYIAVMYRLASASFPGNGAIACSAPIAALLAIPSFSQPIQHIYDMPVLFLSACGYYLMLTRQFRWYLALFALATFNKETSIFLLLFFALWFYRPLDRKIYGALLAWQVVLYVIIRAALMMAYADNADWFLNRNYFFPVFNDLLRRSSIDGVLALAVLFWLLTARWQEKPDFLKTILWLLPVMYAAHLVFGFPREYRVFFDILPPLVLLATHTLVAAAGFSKLDPFRNKGGGE